MSGGIESKLASMLPRWIVAWLINIRDRLMHAVGYMTLPVKVADLTLLGSVRHWWKCKVGRAPSVLFFPDIPNHKSISYKLCVLCGFRIVEDVKSYFDVLIWYENRTYSEYVRSYGSISKSHSCKKEEVWYENRKTRGSHKNIKKLSKKSSINLICENISKSKVGECFRQVFDYKINVDPKTYSGKIVVKPDQNGSHSGKVVNGPLLEEEIEKDKVYQKEIKNVNEYSMVIDLRVPYLDGEIPFVYKKERPVETRFSNTNSSVQIKEKEELFSSEEVKKITNFISQMNAEFAEVDVLRDREAGRIYILDVNNTPWGPPNGLSESKKREALRLLQGGFRKMVERRVH